MGRNTVCSWCGNKFDEKTVETMFDQKYAPNKYYSDLDDHFCMACITKMIRNGTLDVSGFISSEREPDINSHLGNY